MEATHERQASHVHTYSHCAPPLPQMVCWVAEEQKLMANPKKPAQGTIIEAYLDKGRGAVATLLVQV